MARRPSKREYLKRCRERIDSAKNFRKQEGYDELWERLIDLYRGKHFPKGLTNEDRIAINIAFSTINVIAPSISVNYPKITVLARTPEQDDRAVILEAAVNYWWRTYEFKPEFQRGVKDMLILGFGWLKTGYRFVEEDEPLDDNEVTRQVAELIGEADGFAEENPDLAGDVPTDEEIAASVPNVRAKVVEDRPFVERLSPFDVYVDPEATSLQDCRWIAQRIIKDLDEVRNDERYKPSARKSIKKGDLTLGEELRPERMRAKDENAQRVTVWEFYDLRTGKMAVFAEVGDDFLVDPMDQPYEFGHPFVMLRNYEIPDVFYPMGELEAIEDLQQELNKTRSQQMNHRKRGARKYLADKRAFTKGAVAQLESEQDGAVIFVNEGVPLNEAILPVPQVPVDPQLYQDSEQIESDMNVITGVSEYQRGGQSELRRTATEASIIQDAANARAADKLAGVEQAIGLIARRLVQLAQQYMTEATVVRLVGANGHPVWAEVEPQWIQGEFDFEVEGGSTQPMNETFRRQTAMQLLQTLMPFADPQLGLVNAAELIRYALQFGFGIKDPAKFLAQGPQMADPATGQPLGAPDEEMMEEPPMEQMPPEAGAPPADVGGVPPELLAQLSGQVGLNL